MQMGLLVGNDNYDCLSGDVSVDLDDDDDLEPDNNNLREMRVIEDVCLCVCVEKVNRCGFRFSKSNNFQMCLIFST